MVVCVYQWVCKCGYKLGHYSVDPERGKGCAENGGGPQDTRNMNVERDSGGWKGTRGTQTEGRLDKNGFCSGNVIVKANTKHVN